MSTRVKNVVAAAAILCVPCAALLAAAWGVIGWDAATVISAVMCCVPFFLSFERRAPSARIGFLVADKDVKRLFLLRDGEDALLNLVDRAGFFCRGAVHFRADTVLQACYRHRSPFGNVPRAADGIYGRGAFGGDIKYLFRAGTVDAVSDVLLGNDRLHRGHYK